MEIGFGLRLGSSAKVVQADSLQLVTGIPSPVDLARLGSPFAAW